MQLDIAFCVPGLPFDGQSWYDKPLGGSESAAIGLARALAARGHRPVIFANTQTNKVDGVSYQPIQRFGAYGLQQPHDVTVIQRRPDWFSQPYESKLQVCWLHDMAHAQDRPGVQSVTWNIDLFAALSEFHMEQIASEWRLDRSQLWHTSNAVSAETITEHAAWQTDSNRILFAARPERGLDVLLELMPHLLERRPNLVLDLCTYTDAPERFAGFYQECERVKRQLGDHVNDMGQLTKPQLYRVMSRAGAYVYPTPSPILPDFREISCINAMEAQQCGTPVVTTATGALPETVRMGELVHTLPHEAGFVDAFCDAVERTLDQSFEPLDMPTWDDVAERWERRIFDAIAERNDSADRLYTYFLRRSDIGAANELAKREDRIDWLRQLREGWPHFYSEQALRQYYESRDYHVHDELLMYSRMNALVGLTDPMTPTSILEIGCGDGVSGIHIANQFPDVPVTFVDVSEQALNAARLNVDAHMVNPERASFANNLSALDESFDLVVASEVVEHVADPVAFLRQCEAYTRAALLISTPYGPWEVDTRDHLWHFDYHDIIDICGDKQREIFYSPETPGLRDEQCGNYFWIVKPDSKPWGELDMDRHLRHQRPPQTVSCTFIAGPNAEKTLLWMLDSVSPYVDELVAVDTGLSIRGHRMLSEYAHELVDGPNPLESGFDEARNVGLRECRGDWVLWIDTDERLCSGRGMNKYLRESPVNGCCINQHHFHVDQASAPDQPVRLFRNRPYQGKRMRFIGRIHEHPELGINEGPGPVMLLSDVHIAHVGYLHANERLGRFVRNKPMLEMDERDYPERILQKHFRIRDNVIEVQQRIQANGGMGDRERGMLEESIQLYRDYFAGNSRYQRLDTRNYYSHAVELLGRGFEVKMGLDHGWPGQLDGAVRYDSVEDLEQDVQALLAPIYDRYA